MKNLEDELRKALRRVDPPAGFARRVLEEVRRREAGERWQRARRLFLFRRPVLRWASALALVLLAGASLEYWRYQRTRVEGERAKAQLKLALEVSSTKLNVALRQADRRLMGNQ